MIRTVLRYWGPPLGYAGLIFYVSSLSHPDERLPSFFQGLGDKALHAAEYTVLGALLYRAFRWGTSREWSRQAVPLAIMAASLYGLSDEVHQLFVPFRDSSWQDWVADTIGATIGALTMHWITPWPAVGRGTAEGLRPNEEKA